MFWPKIGLLIYNSTSLPSLLIIFSSFFHNTSYATWTTPSFNCRHPLLCVHTSHWPYGYPLIYVVLMATSTLEPMMQFATPLSPLHEMLISMLDKKYYMRFFQPHSTPFVDKSTLCQRWHSHFSQCCHCRPNLNIFIFLILHNSKICRLKSSQGKELLQLTLH
jgi:hypothetical protein